MLQEFLFFTSGSSAFQKSFKLIFMYHVCKVHHYKASKVSLMIKVTIKTWELLPNCTAQVIWTLIELKKVTAFLYLPESYPIHRYSFRIIYSWFWDIQIIFKNIYVYRFKRTNIYITTLNKWYSCKAHCIVMFSNRFMRTKSSHG